MKKGVAFVFAACMLMLTWTTGCSDKKPVAADSVVVDSLPAVDTAAVDTMDQLISEQEDNSGIPSWIHIGYKDHQGRQHRRMLSMHEERYYLWEE